jgi:hypothetical protein
MNSLHDRLRPDSFLRRCHPKENIWVNESKKKLPYANTTNICSVRWRAYGRIWVAMPIIRVNFRIRPFLMSPLIICCGYRRLPSTGLRTTDFLPTSKRSERLHVRAPGVQSCSLYWRLGRWCYDSRQLVHPSMYSSFYRTSLKLAPNLIFLALGNSGSKSNTLDQQSQWFTKRSNKVFLAELEDRTPFYFIQESGSRDCPPTHCAFISVQSSLRAMIFYW